jgi:hypothetical protein
LLNCGEPVLHALQCVRLELGKLPASCLCAIGTFTAIPASVGLLHACAQCVAIIRRLQCTLLRATRVAD